MTFTLPPLPYSMNALAPHISEETLEYHYGKHHQTYVNNLNNLVENTPFAGASLEKIILEATGPLFNNAAQVWNHTFYWNCLSQDGGKTPTGKLAEKITRDFGSLAKFKEEFTQSAIKAFGSAWAWLCVDKSGKLVIKTTSNAGTPMTEGLKAILTCDVWEHAYYIDYRNRRPDYLNAFWELVNWEFVQGLLND
ncbi:MAG: superoxide dismutase [Legionellales bacterium RIFCSPHIGHO2_12_FULL_37_14]|nr:MAG: superoxide dismutase [Legionellales bacterium RIFCSPHIGHO2_12_FULL_37_14]